MSQTTQVPEVDPLEAFEKRPSVSFSVPHGGYAKGVKTHFVVQSYGELIVDRDSETKEINFWPLKPGEKEPQPKRKYVLSVLDITEDSDGVEKTLWAKPVRKGKSLFAALIAAQKKVQADTGDKEYRMKPGDELFIVYLGDDKSVPAKMGNHPKMFAAKLVPGAAQPTNEDPFSEGGADDGSASSDPWAEESTPTAGATTPSEPDLDPFGGSDGGEGDEPPF